MENQGRKLRRTGKLRKNRETKENQGRKLRRTGKLRRNRETKENQRN